ncbi:MAG: HAD hydrolase family protein [Planctomycetota bacterium]
MPGTDSSSKRSCDLIALDLDGTLLDPSGRVSDANIAAIERARAEGARVLVATGRGLVESEKILRRIDQRDPVIVAGGALTADPVTKRSIDRVPMQPGLVRHAVEEIHHAKHAALILKDPTEAGYDYLVLAGDHDADPDPVTVMWFEMTGVTVRYAARLEDDEHPELTVRVGMGAHPSEAGPIADQLRSAFAGEATFHQFTTTEGPAFKSGGRSVQILEVFDSTANKWTALSRQAERFGVRPERICAIGDEINDESMIAGAGIGIAMGNAVDTIKRLAKYETRPNAEDGVAHAIDRVLAGEW